jgi:hypothetical protein
MSLLATRGEGAERAQWRRSMERQGAEAEWHTVERQLRPVEAIGAGP